MVQAWQRTVIWLTALLAAGTAAAFLVFSASSRRGELGPHASWAEVFALVGLLGAGMLLGYGISARLGRGERRRRRAGEAAFAGGEAQEGSGELSAALWEHPQLSTSVNSLLEMLAQVLRPHGIVLLRACAGQKFVAVKVWPESLMQQGAIKPGAHLWERALLRQLSETRRALTLRKLPRGSRRIPYYGRTQVLRDLLLAPIRRGTTLTAILAVDRDGGRVFKTSDIRLAQHAANQIGLALELQTALADQAAQAQINAKLLVRMERMAITDGLTGLNNHRQFQASFETHLACAERYGRKLSLILADIDHFKQVNDVHGHLVGDKVLRRIAAILLGSARRTDVVARYGGEEFAVLMEETGPSGARIIAERMRRAVEDEQFYDENGAFKATLSLGVATYPLHGAEKERLIACADQALYQAKRSGRNQTAVFDAKLDVADQGTQKR